MKLAISCTLFIIFISTTYATRDCLANDPIEIEPGLYISTKDTSDGPLYFAMERLDQENIDIWRMYHHISVNISTSSGSSIPYLLCNMMRFKISGKLVYKNFYDNESFIDGFGGDKKYFIEFVSKVEGNFPAADDLIRLIEKNQNTVIGANYAIIELASKGKEIYITYASKSPINSRFIPKNWDEISEKDELTFYEFEQAFGDIVMSVGTVDFVGTSYYNNRGIFRNPAKLFEKKFRGISLDLHGFSAHVLKKYFHKEKLFISAAPSMIHIIDRSTPTYAHPTPKEQESYTTEKVSGDRDIVISTEKLSLHFLANDEIN